MEWQEADRAPKHGERNLQSPIVPSAMSGFPFQEAQASVQRRAGPNEDENDSPVAPEPEASGSRAALQQAAVAARFHQAGWRQENPRGLPRQKTQQDAREA